MARTPTAAEAKLSLTEHVTAKGVEIFAKYGPRMGWPELQRLLEDRAYVRYPCTVVFDSAPLLPGEFAHPVQKGGKPEEGFTMYVHPLFQADLGQVPALVLYQLVAVNYGEFAAADDAENFGAAALGLTRDEYYAGLCAQADRLGMDREAAPPSAGGDEGGGCGH
ncbi:MAG: hypothetical protein FJ399_11645 [Verrucomicrobia bacterium]|nr:hypothetical protein [Verrucomicrobiota bacterium]